MNAPLNFFSISCILIYDSSLLILDRRIIQFSYRPNPIIPSTTIYRSVGALKPYLFLPRCLPSVLLSVSAVSVADWPVASLLTYWYS